MAKNQLPPTAVPSSPVNEGIDTHLAAMYSDTNGNIPDLSRIKKASGRPVIVTVLLTLVTILILGVVTWAGYQFFSQPETVANDGNKVDLTIESVDSVISGDEITYTLHLHNRESINLFNASLEFTLPVSVAVTATEPATTLGQQLQWRFDVVKPNEDITVSVKGRVIGEIDTVITSKAVVVYRPSNFNSEFRLEKSSDVPIDDSFIQVAVESPTKTIANQPVTYKVRVANLGPVDLTDLRLQAQYPSSFVFNQGDPAPDNSHNNMWNITSLKKGEEFSLTLSGSYGLALEEEQSTILFQVMAKDHQDKPVLQAQATGTTSISRDKLSLTVQLNGSAENQVVEYGEDLSYTVIIENQSQVPLKNVNVSLTLESGVIDWDQAALARGALADGTVSWGPEQITALSEIGANSSTTLVVTLPLRDATKMNEPEKLAWEIKSKAQAKYQTTEEGDYTLDSLVNAGGLRALVNTDFAFQSILRYFDDDNTAVGSGPVPPVVGETTTYLVTWNVANHLHQLDKMRLVATVPDGVSWQNKADVTTGSIFFDAQTKQVVWELSRLPATVNQATAVFQLSLTPTAEHEGKVMNVITDISAKGTDAYTGQVLTRNLPELTSALLKDPFLKDDGEVRAE